MRGFVVLSASSDLEGVARYRVQIAPRFEPLLLAAPEGLRASFDRRHIELDVRFRAAQDPLARELLLGLQRFETLRFEVPAARRRLLLDAEAPTIVGILNRTPDSFSDGGSCADLGACFARAEELVRGGARWLDVGGESTRPGAPPVDLQEELDRVLPAIEGLAARFEAFLSVDTRKAEVARAALGSGADLVNDVSAGTSDPRMLATCAELCAPLVMNHMRGTPETMQQGPRYDDALWDVASELAGHMDAGLNAGIALPRILVDPGFGFGKRFEDNLQLLGGIEALRTLGRPIFAGASRKSFLGALLDGREAARRDDATSAATAQLAAQRVAAIRVHDAQRAADVARVAARLAHESRPRPWF